MQIQNAIYARVLSAPSSFLQQALCPMIRASDHNDASARALLTVLSRARAWHGIWSEIIIIFKVNDPYDSKSLEL